MEIAENRSTRGQQFVARVLPLVLTAALAWIFVSPTTSDPDLWGHLRYGLDNVAAGQVLRTDVYSYLTVPGTWVNHEWLAEVSMALAYMAGGVAGLAGLKFVLLGISLTAIYAAGRARGAGTVAACVAALGVLLLLRPVASSMRPLQFTIMGFSVLMYVLTIHEKHPSAVWLLPPLFVVWTNAHGGFLAGIAFLGLAVLIEGGRALSAENDWRAVFRKPFLSLAQAGVASLVATLVNPYGFGLWKFLLDTATGARPEISEWQPLFVYPEFAGVLAIYVVLGLWAVYRSRQKLSPLLLSLYIVGGIAANVAVRHLLFFAIAWGVFHAEHLQMAGAYLLRPIRLSRPTSRILLGLSTVLVLGLWALQVPESFRMKIIDDLFPARAVELIHRNLPEGRLLVDFDWGQYALWHLGPDVKVSMDGRRETVYSERVYQQYLDFMNGMHTWDAYLENGSPDLVLVYNESPSYNLMSLRPDWTLVYEDELCGLFAQTGSPLAEKLVDALPPAIPVDGYTWQFP